MKARCLGVVAAFAALALLALPGAQALPCNPFCIDVSLEGHCSGDVAICTGNSQGSLLAVGGRNAESGMVAAAVLPQDEEQADSSATNDGNAQAGLVAVALCGNAEAFVAVAPNGNANGTVPVGGLGDPLQSC